MKLYSILFILPFLIISCAQSKTTVGTYVSRTATDMEAIRIMYLKGYFPFLEIPDDYIKLTIEKDSTFLYVINNKKHFGRWKVTGKTLTLHYSEDSMDDLKLKIRNDKLYNITEATLCKSKKKMMRLMLLEKK